MPKAQGHPPLILLLLLLPLFGCASLSSSRAPNWTKLQLNKQEQIDMHVLKSDLYAMNSNWLQAQIELEYALELRSDRALQLRRSLLLAQRGQYSLAEEEIKNLIYNNETADIEAYLALGEIQALQNKGLESIATYKQVLSLEKDNYKALIFLGAIYSQLNNFKAAQYYFRRLKSVKNQEHLGYYYLGRLYQQTKSYQHSVLEFKKCLKVKEDFSDCHYSLADSYILNSEKNKAIQVLEENKEMFSEHEKTFAKLYDLYTETEQPQKAFDQLVVLERFEPQNTYIKLQMAMHFLSQKEIALTEDKLLEILQISPDFERASFLLTSIFAKEEDMDKTVKYHSHIKSNSPYYVDSALLTARVVEKKKGVRAALNFTEESNANNPDARLSIYKALLHSRLNHPQKSIKVLEKLVKKDGKNTQALYYLGHLYGEQKNYDKAIVNMRRVLRQDPNHVDALNYIAYYFAENKLELEEALFMAEKAHELRPDDGHILDTIGWIYFQMGKFEDAEKFLEKAYVLLPDEGVIAEHLAQVYTSKGFADKALQVYNKLLQQGVVNRERILRQINSIKKPVRSTSSSK